MHSNHQTADQCKHRSTECTTNTYHGRNSHEGPLRVKAGGVQVTAQDMEVANVVAFEKPGDAQTNGRVDQHQDHKKQIEQFVVVGQMIETNEHSFLEQLRVCFGHKQRLGRVQCSSTTWERVKSRKSRKQKEVQGY